MCCTRGVNLATIIDPHPDDAVALVDRSRITTYGELRRQAGSLRAGLVRLGVEPGDRVALLAPNNWFFVVSYLAALGAGAAVVPLNPASTTAELERQLAATGARVAVVGPSGREAFARVDRAAAGLEHVLAPEGTRIDGAETLQDYFDEVPVDGVPADAVDRAPDDIAALLFTAGTAGTPKAAMLTHGNLLANLDQVHAPPRARRPARRRGARRAAAVPHLRAQRRARPGPARRRRGRPRRALRSRSAASRPSATTASPSSPGAPPMFEAWSTARGIDADAFALRPPRGLRRRAAAGRGVARRSRPGSASPSGRATASPRRRRSSARHSSAASRARARSACRCPASRSASSTRRARTRSPATPGEIWVRGPNVFPGYWHDEEATAAALHPRRLAAHGRHRRGRRRRLPLHRRPGQGPHHRVGLQRLPGRGRGGAARASRHRGRGRRRRRRTRTRARR